MPSLRTQVARQLRSNMTVSEHRLWSHLRRRQVNGWKFRRQAPIGEYVVDFVCLAAKLVIELDGISHDESKFEYDQRRQAWLESQGYKVLTFSADYPEQDYLEGVVDAIYLELAAIAFPSRPLPRLRRGDPSGLILCAPPRRAGR